MASFECLPPYNGYRGYRIFHRGEGRWYVQMINPETGHRTTTSLARYTMAVSLGRFLTLAEQVDHIDNDKTNDHISNLQILDAWQNNNKAVDDNGRFSVLVELICPICKTFFERPPNQVNHKLRKGKQICCSRICGYKLLSANMLASGS